MRCVPEASKQTSKPRAVWSGNIGQIDFKHQVVIVGLVVCLRVSVEGGKGEDS
jgi:hypothetical protein